MKRSARKGKTRGADRGAGSKSRRRTRVPAVRKGRPASSPGRRNKAANRGTGGGGPAPAPMLRAGVTVAEGVQRDRDESRAAWQGGANPAGGLSAGAVGQLSRTLIRVAPKMAAVGHPTRAKILAKLVEGPATYRSLQRLTGRKAGPLYFHLGELRSMGLILPKQRDLYELTRGGRNLALVMAAAEPLLRDRRRRPLAQER